jgi:hypothetical protein
MRVRLHSIYASPAGCYDAGTIVDFPDAEALDLIAGRYAEAVDPVVPEVMTRPTPVVETAVDPVVPETATRRGPGRPRG